MTLAEYDVLIERVEKLEQQVKNLINESDEDKVRWSFIKFWEGEIAVSCEGRNEIEKFLLYLEGKGLKWAQGEFPISYMPDDIVSIEYERYEGLKWAEGYNAHARVIEFDIEMFKEDHK